jgi:hypothetical protein
MLSGSYKLSEQMERHSYRIVSFQDERWASRALGELQELFSQLLGGLQVSLGYIEETAAPLAQGRAAWFPPTADTTRARI